MTTKNIPKKNKEKINKKKINKKQVNKSSKPHITCFKLLLSLLLIFSIGLSYFLILISIKPRPSPFIAAQIEQYINDNLGYKNVIKIDNALLSFHKFYKIKIIIDDIDLNLDSKEEFLFPKIEAEFSIFNLLLLRYIPSTIRVINPIIEINNLSDKKNPQIAINGINYQNILDFQKYFGEIWEIFSSIKNRNLPIKNFEIQDAQIILKNKDGTHHILLKNFSISTFLKSDSLQLNSSSKINIHEHDLDINSHCQFKNDNSLKCDISLFNLIPASIAHMLNQPNLLSKINSLLNVNLSLEINQKHQLSNLLFNLNAQTGSFDYPKFFNKTMVFNNLFISGELNNLSKTLNIHELSTDFKQSQSTQSKPIMTKLTMSMTINNFMNIDKQYTNLQIVLNNVATYELEKFWPVSLSNNNIKKWIIEHISSGTINDAYVKMTFNKIANIQKLDKIQAELIFSDLNLKYSQNFPAINNLNGIATFDKQSMKIDLISGNTLNSKIKSATVTINDFSAKEKILNINTVTEGPTTDIVKYAAYKDNNIVKKISKYLDGTSNSIFNIMLPIKNNISLQDSYINIIADIKNFNNSYITDNSALTVKTLKNFNSNDFITDIDLTNANINLTKLGIFKKKNITSKIKTIISFDKYKQLHLENFGWNNKNANITGRTSMQTSPLLKIINLKVVNNNFGRNNFILSYNIDKKNSVQNLKINGKYLDLSPLIINQIKNISHNKEAYKNHHFQIKLSKLYLANNQNLKNLNININCIEVNCGNSFIKADMNNDNNININIFKKSGNNYSTIRGRITDISLLIKGLDLSDKMIFGDSKIKGKFKLINNQQTIDSKLTINTGFTILKNEVVEEISKKNSFGRLKNKINKSDKTEFDRLELKFQLQNNILLIKELIASSYFMGFTSKGNINLSTGAIKFKGLIVPGYSVNRLFGILDIPILKNIISPIVTGEKGGGIFAIRYSYDKTADQKEGKFKINPSSLLTPGATRHIFDLFY